MVVSRAENKLAGASREFVYDFRGKTVLDIGSSTGGFTEFALKSGASKVFAVEKGTNQMKSPLRLDSRIDLREKTDIFKVSREDFNFQDYFEKGSGEHLDVILADVSFMSLKKVLLHAKYNLASINTDFLVMLKPQFEAKSFELKRGVVKNEAIRRGIIKEFEAWLKKQGFIIVKKRDNDLAGRNGNLERFYLLKLAKKY
ncbi:MAG: SAM-dependent methyltransferase [Candidatus Saccharibacteria bacterium]|nr:SAM-dependent methyltransferase [Candidatus Saccharibacteria bacterium]